MRAPHHARHGPLHALLLLLVLAHAAPMRVGARPVAVDGAGRCASDGTGCTLVEQFFDRLIDRNGDGRATAVELRAYFDSLDDRSPEASVEPVGVYAYANDLKQLLMRYDGSGDGAWSRAEFLAAFGGMAPLRAGQEPEQLHLSMSGERSYTVMWVTRLPTNTSTVQFGFAAGQLTQTATGTTHTYTAGGWKGVIHEVELRDLPYGTRVHYRAGDAAGGWTEPSEFRTRPAPGDAAHGVDRLAMFGDMGTAIPLGFAVTNQMAKDAQSTPIDLYVHVGDVAYASTKTPLPPQGAALRDPDADNEHQFIWDLWFNQVVPLAARSPYAIAFGNHEKFFNCSAYLNRLRMPAPWGGDPAHLDKTGFWFSLDWGRVHVVFMSSEDYIPGSSYAPQSAQYQWLERDLARARDNRAQTPWIILTAHRPMYSSDVSELNSHWPGASFMRTIEPLMLRYGVDLYVCGHMHVRRPRCGAPQRAPH